MSKRGRRIWLATAVFLALSVSAETSQAATRPTDTGVVNVSRSPDRAESEQPLSVNPLNPNQLTTVANVFSPNTPGPLQPYFGKGGIDDTRVYSSQDGGLHWKTFKLDQGGVGTLATPLPPLFGLAPEYDDTLNVVNTDADSIWDRHGNAYFESGDIHGIHHGGNEVATVWRSQDGGATWGPKDGYTAVNATQEHKELDRPWFAIDNSGGEHDGRLYMTFETTPFAEIPPEVYVKHSDDHGQTWSPTVRVDDGLYETQYNARQKPVVASDGTLYVVYDRAPASVTPFTPQQGTIRLTLARSTDGGTTFKRFTIDNDVHRVQSPDEATSAYTEMIPAIAADPTNPRRVAVAWPEARNADNSRIELRYTTDGGAHWSKRLDVADDPAAKHNQHDHVTLAWYSDGRLFAGWRDRRCCGGSFTDRYEQRVRVLDRDRTGALVPGRTVRYSTGPETLLEGERGALAPDEFQGLVATRIGVGLTWSKLIGERFDLVFRRVPLHAFTPPCVDRRKWVFRLHRAPGQRIVRATAYVNGHRVRRIEGHNLRRLVIQKLPKGRFTLRIVKLTSAGHRVISVRTYRGCRKGAPRTHVERPHHH